MGVPSKVEVHLNREKKKPVRDLKLITGDVLFHPESNGYSMVSPAPQNNSNGIKSVALDITQLGSVADNKVQLIFNGIQGGQRFLVENTEEVIHVGHLNTLAPHLVHFLAEWKD